MNHTNISPEQQAALDWWADQKEQAQTEESIERFFQENEAQYNEDLEEFKQKYPEVFC